MEGAVQDLKKLDHPAKRPVERKARREILDYMEKRIAKAADPRTFGKPLRHSKFGLWRYHLREYRVICQLQNAKLMVLVIAAGHRSTIYED